MTDNNNPQIPQLTAGDKAAKQWNGYTLEELKLKRAMALVRAQVGKEKLGILFDGTKERVADNGLRGLLFNDSTINNLRTADYLLMGFKLANSMFKFWRKNKRK